MKKYNDVAILYYVRAYIEVNKLLVEVETDEEIESTKLLGEEYYLTHFERTLNNKSKYISEIMSYCRAYFQLSIIAFIFITLFIDLNYFSYSIAENLYGFSPRLNQILIACSELCAFPFILWLLPIIPRKAAGIILNYACAIICFLLTFIKVSSSCEDCA